MLSDASQAQLSALLPQLGADGIKLLIPYLTQLDAETGRVLVRQGDRGTDVFFLLNGKFSVFEKIQINSSDVVLQVATFAGPGVLGEVSIMTATPRTATVVVLERADCLVLTRDKFNDLVKLKPQTGIEILQALGAVMYSRQVNFQNKVRSNILRESLSIEAGIAKMARYTGRVSRTSPALAQKLFAEDFRGVNYDSD